MVLVAESLLLAKWRNCWGDLVHVLQFIVILLYSAYFHKCMEFENLGLTAAYFFYLERKH